MNVLVAFTLSDNFRFLEDTQGCVSKAAHTRARRRLSSARDSSGALDQRHIEVGTCLVQGIRELSIDVFHYGRNLMFQFEFVTFVEVQAWSVDNGQEHSIKSGFTYLDAGGANRFCMLRSTPHEAFHGSLLLCGCGWGGVCSVEDKAQQRRLPRPFCSCHLSRKTFSTSNKPIRMNKTSTIRLKGTGTRALR